MVPGVVRVLPESSATVQVTSVLAVPLICAANCTWLPMVAVAGLGVTVTGGKV